MKIFSTALCITSCLVIAPAAYSTSYTLNFSGNGWRNPVEGIMKTDTVYDYLSTEYYCLRTYCSSKSETYYQHVGVDIVAGFDKQVFSISKGTVYKVTKDDNSTDYNKSVVEIKHETDDGRSFIAVYGHCYADDGIKKDVPVERGSKICHIRRFNTPTHLHFEIQEREEANPWGYLPKGENATKQDWRDPDVFLNNYYPKLDYFQVEENRTVVSWPFASSVSIAWYPPDKSCEQADLWAYNGIASYQYTKDICRKAYNELKSFNWKYMNKYWQGVFFGTEKIEPVCQ